MVKAQNYEVGDFVKFKDSFEGLDVHETFNEYCGTIHEITKMFSLEKSSGTRDADFVADDYWWPERCINKILKREDYPEGCL